MKRIVFLLSYILFVNSIYSNPNIKNDSINIEEKEYQLFPFQKRGENRKKEQLDTVPEFPGGNKALLIYIGQKLKYPESAMQRGEQGTVFIRFLVDKTGSVRNVEITKGFDPECDVEAVRIIQSLPKWKPGVKDGKPVDVYLNIPISFKLKAEPQRNSSNPYRKRSF